MIVWLPAVTKSPSAPTDSANADGIVRRVIAAAAARERRRIARRIGRLLGRTSYARLGGDRQVPWSRASMVPSGGSVTACAAQEYGVVLRGRHRRGPTSGSGPPWRTAVVWITEGRSPEGPARDGALGCSRGLPRVEVGGGRADA